MNSSIKDMTKALLLLGGFVVALNAVEASAATESDHCENPKSAACEAWITSEYERIQREKQQQRIGELRTPEEYEEAVVRKSTRMVDNYIEYKMNEALGKVFSKLP